MPLIKVKPTSPGRRALVKVVTPELHKGEPHWPLLLPSLDRPTRRCRSFKAKVTSGFP